MRCGTGDSRVVLTPKDLKVARNPTRYPVVDKLSVDMLNADGVHHDPISVPKTSSRDTNFQSSLIIGLEDTTMEFRIETTTWLFS